MITYLLNLFAPKNEYNRTEYHRRDRYCGSHYMLDYLKPNVFKKENFHNDARKIIPILEKFVKMEGNATSQSEIEKNKIRRQLEWASRPDSIDDIQNEIQNENIEHYRVMTKIFWSEILQEPKHVLPHPHAEWKIKYTTGFCKQDPIKEMHEFLTLHWAVEMAHQKCTKSKEQLYTKPIIYDLVLKELEESNEDEAIKSIETYQNTILNSISSESGKF